MKTTGESIIEMHTFSMSPILQTNVPGMGGADIHSPERFFTYKGTSLIVQSSDNEKPEKHVYFKQKLMKQT